MVKQKTKESPKAKGKKKYTLIRRSEAKVYVTRLPVVISKRLQRLATQIYARWVSMAYKVHKLLTGPGALAEDPKHRARRGGGGGLTNTTHNHAKMGTFHNNGDALRLQNLVDGHCHLLGQALLKLQAARKHLCNAGKLGKTEDLPVGNVANVHAAGERNQVVLAHGKDLNVLDDDFQKVSFAG